MLEQLKLSNLALSNQAEVDFTPGMICITGETGAGKSLVVDALSLVLGAKADSNLVRQGRKQMEVSALFSIEHNPQVHRLLEAYGFAEEKSSFSRAVADSGSKSHATHLNNATYADNIAHTSNIESTESLADNAIVQNNSLSNKTAKVQALTKDSSERTLTSSLSERDLTQSINAKGKVNTLQTMVLADAGKLEQDVGLTKETAEAEIQVVNGAPVFSALGQTVLPHSSKLESSSLHASQAVNDVADSVVTTQETVTAVEHMAKHAVVADGQAEDIPFATMQVLDKVSNQAPSGLEKEVSTQHESVAAQDSANFNVQQESLSPEVQQGASEPSEQPSDLINTLSTQVVSNSPKVEQEHTTKLSKKHEQDRGQDKVKQSSNARSVFDAEETEETELILRRVVSAEGKSKAYINGHMATLSQLREISECLVAIHGQHASVKLMDEKQQLEIVDNFGKLKPLASKVNHAFNEYAVLRQQLTQLSESQKIGAQAYKQDRYELEELKRLALKEGDYEELEANFDKAMHQAQFMYAVSSLYNLIENSESSITTLLRERQAELDKVKSYDPAIVPLLESIDTALMNLYECSARAEELMAQDMELSSAELEERMSKVHELSRRFACAPQDLYLMTERLEQKVNQFLGLKDQINALTKKVQESRQTYELLCNELTLAREKASNKLATQIGERIKALALPDARFDIVMTRDNEGRPRLNGRDNLCFMFSANLGQDLKPLSAVASGGELSRLALIIEVLTASVKSTPTLIFDEVDTGISGRTASAVGALLKELGQYVQVITVTHLPQVAAKANTQFVVAKYNEDGQVNSTISLLDEQGRIEEISRMIGGSVITDTTRSSAYELLNDF